MHMISIINIDIIHYFSSSYINHLVSNQEDIREL